MDTISVDPKPIWQTAWFRSLGWLPLIFFIARAVEYVQVGTPSQVLWMCHLSNLMLAVGLFLANPFVIRVAVLLLIFGVPPWAVEMAVSRLVTPVSIASHLGGTIVGLIVIAKVGAKPRIWAPSWALYIVVQLICRLTTRPELDINNAHRIYSIWKDTFSSYWQYWPIATLVVGISMWVFEFGLLKLFPREAQKSTA